jgi:hypothetical protein
MDSIGRVEKAPADGLAFQTAGQERTIALAPLDQILHEK